MMLRIASVKQNTRNKVSSAVGQEQILPRICGAAASQCCWCRVRLCLPHLTHPMAPTQQTLQCDSNKTTDPLWGHPGTGTPMAGSPWAGSAMGQVTYGRVPWPSLQAGSHGWVPTARCPGRVPRAGPHVPVPALGEAQPRAVGPGRALQRPRVHSQAGAAQRGEAHDAGSPEQPRRRRRARPRHSVHGGREGGSVRTQRHRVRHHRGRQAGPRPRPRHGQGRSGSGS